jgi:hypothetical protein
MGINRYVHVTLSLYLVLDSLPCITGMCLLCSFQLSGYMAVGHLNHETCMLNSQSYMQLTCTNMLGHNF